jgi:hypothetical protein
MQLTASEVFEIMTPSSSSCGDCGSLLVTLRSVCCGIAVYLLLCFVHDLTVDLLRLARAQFGGFRVLPCLSMRKMGFDGHKSFSCKDSGFRSDAGWKYGSCFLGHCVRNSTRGLAVICMRSTGLS